MDTDTEKVDFDLLESRRQSSTAGLAPGEFDDVEGRRILWRVDRRLVTTAGLMYCISLIDRSNLSSAAIAGMVQDLDLVGNRYSVVSLVFFVTYILFQPPSTVVVRKIGPRIHISSITLLWGIVIIGQAFVKNYQTLVGLRVLLGLFEAGYFPCVVYLLSTWYTRYEVGKRFSFFYVIGCLASAFAGILAFGLTKLDGRGGIAGWRWIFLVEGLLTCVISLAGYWFLVDFPDSSRKSWNFLNHSERQWIIKRVNVDRGDAETPKFNLGKFLGAGLDWKIWAQCMIAFGTTTMNYALAYFLPIILNDNLGYSVGTAQCLTAPPYVLAGVVMWSLSWVGDRYHIRGPIVVVNMLIAVTGIALLGWAANNGVRYFGAFLLTAGANSNVPASLAYQANNVRGQWKRAFTSAVWVGMGGVGGIAGSLVFRYGETASAGVTSPEGPLDDADGL
ncbi:MFS general substrate transporter [Xylariaceae sp. FL0804]|nr:MFS general substrate transporter [Xylariaceae sp. FL0804]